MSAQIVFILRSMTLHTFNKRHPGDVMEVVWCNGISLQAHFVVCFWLRRHILNQALTLSLSVTKCCLCCLYHLFQAAFKIVTANEEVAVTHGRHFLGSAKWQHESWDNATSVKTGTSQY